VMTDTWLRATYACACGHRWCDPSWYEATDTCLMCGAECEFTDLEKLPMADLIVANHGSLYLLTPISEAGASWVDEHLPGDALTWCDGVVIEPRYLYPILEDAIGDGLEVTA